MSQRWPSAVLPRPAAELAAMKTAVQKEVTEMEDRRVLVNKKQLSVIIVGSKFGVYELL